MPKPILIVDSGVGGLLVLKPIRNLLPDMGGIDFSPMVLILGILLLQRLIEGVSLDLLA